MTNDKALEAAARALFLVDYPKDDWGRFGADDYHPNKYRAKAYAAISAYFSALPGEAEVVVYATPHAIADFKAGAIGVRHGLYGSPIGLAHVPLVTLASLQAMQARAEAAERERDEASNVFKELIVAMAQEGMGVGDKEGGGLLIRNRKAEASDARVKELEEALAPAQLHVEQLSELLKIIREHWIDYDHVFSIAVHEADEWLESRTALTGGSNG